MFGRWTMDDGRWLLPSIVHRPSSVVHRPELLLLLKHPAVNLLSRIFQAQHEVRDQSAWFEVAEHLTVFVGACLSEAEDVLQNDGVAFHALYLGDVGDLARAVA